MRLAPAHAVASSDQTKRDSTGSGRSMAWAPPPLLEPNALIIKAFPARGEAPRAEQDLFWPANSVRLDKRPMP
jgi:hypothetical protein